MFAYPSQRLQDYLSQLWCIWTGRRIDPAAVPWLMGPFGNVDVIADRYVARLCAEENLTLERQGKGLLESAEVLGLSGPEAARLCPEVARFYTCTSDFNLDVWSEWSVLFCPFGNLLAWLYSRRLEQLNVPLHPLETAHGMTSEIFKLREPDTGRARYTVWYRRLASTGRVIYSGIYSTARLPDGRTCVKVVFPLPRGNATVLMAIAVGADGRLELTSAGRRFGDPGFYFLLTDSRGRYYARYVRSFRERITVYVDDRGTLRADHLLTLWHLRVLRLHYRMMAKGGGIQHGDTEARRRNL